MGVFELTLFLLRLLGNGSNHFRRRKFRPNPVVSRLGGFELLSSLNEDLPVIYDYGNHIPDTSRFLPPEIEKNGWTIVKR